MRYRARPILNCIRAKRNPENGGSFSPSSQKEETGRAFVALLNDDLMRERSTKVNERRWLAAMIVAPIADNKIADASRCVSHISHHSFRAHSPLAAGEQFEYNARWIIILLAISAVGFSLLPLRLSRRNFSLARRYRKSFQLTVSTFLAAPSFVFGWFINNESTRKGESLIYLFHNFWDYGEITLVDPFFLTKGSKPWWAVNRWKRQTFNELIFRMSEQVTSFILNGYCFKITGYRIPKFTTDVYFPRRETDVRNFTEKNIRACHLTFSFWTRYTSSFCCLVTPKKSSVILLSRNNIFYTRISAKLVISG